MVPGRFLSCCLATLLLTSVSCATADPPRTLPPDSSTPATRATLQLGQKELADGRFVGLAFSGGGSRAAVFGAAVMKELERAGLLSQVDVLSAVSGGALPAASYALEGFGDFRFQDGFVEQIGRDIQGAVAGPWYAAPHNLVRYAFKDTIPAEPVIRALDDQLFHGATFADLNPSRPILLLNATDALTGDPLVIAEERFAPLGIALAPFSMARAVYMSAAYPGVLEPLRLRDSRAGTNGAPANPVLAYDGGAADNLGIRTLMHVVEGALVNRSMTDLFPQGCLIISIDATGRQRNETHTPLSAAAALLRGHRRNVLELVGIPASQQDMAQFGSFRVGGDDGGGSCRFWHVALRQLPDTDPLGAHVTHIKTNLGLSAEDQAALITAAGRLVAKGREEMNGMTGWVGFLESKPALFSHP
ncbi:MAG: hypothetical protein ABS70_02475 [Nitrospira sp. SCN 59-13]|nr:MAG: hypothetical protein ABS70_02475 [Nitrospira sp. SCN 59-13]